MVTGRQHHEEKQKLSGNWKGIKDGCECDSEKERLSEEKELGFFFHRPV
jgi:hypothetical protein